MTGLDELGLIDRLANSQPCNFHPSSPSRPPSPMEPLLPRRPKKMTHFRDAEGHERRAPMKIAAARRRVRPACAKQELIFEILRRGRSGLIFRGCPRDVAGRVRVPACTRLQPPPRPDDIYVSPSQIRKFDLHRRHGVGPDPVAGKTARRIALIKVEVVSFEPPERAERSSKT